MVYLQLFAEGIWKHLSSTVMASARAGRGNYSLMKDFHAVYFLRVGVGLFAPLPGAALGGAGLAGGAAGAGCPLDSGISMGSFGGMIVLAVKVGLASGIFSP